MVHEKRACKRIPISLIAELINSGKTYVACIGNISEHGLYMMINPMDDAKDFTHKTEIALRFQLRSGEILNLNCKKIWSYKISPFGIRMKMGMEIIDPPTKYKELLNSLQ